MKEFALKIYNKYKKYVIICGIGLGLIILGCLSWKLVFVKYKEFYQEEKKFTNAVKRYYEYHQKYLPRDGESKDMTLQQLYDLDILDDLRVPGKRKTCDPNSWVRVFKNEDGEYKYITYLKCGKYSSRVDHTGPEILLNGDLKINVALNSEYKELGVVEVKDNKDGKIDIKNVEIDSSKVNTGVIGTYPVTYTVKDSKRNKTVVTREVTVVKGLTDTVRQTASGDGYYKGSANNYVLFSGMLWKIVKVNEDGTVKLILNDSVTNLRFNHTEYKDSNTDTWLKNVFYKALEENGSKEYLVKTKYCVGNINSMNDYSTYCDKSVKRYVGLLDIDEYYKTFDGNNSSSIYSKSFALGHKIGDNYADGTYLNDRPAGTTPDIIAPIRPTLTLVNNMTIESGEGTIHSPYKLNDYNYADKKDKINTRLVGEYLEYSGLTFRIIGKYDDNVRVIMDKQWTVQPSDLPIYITATKVDKWKFDLTDDNNPGYTINNDYLDYLDTKYIVDTEYEVPTNDANKKYTAYKTKKVKAKVLLPKTYELFAAIGQTPNMYMYIDSSTNNKMLFIVNASNGKIFELNKDDFESYTIKAIITLKGNLKIESGKGTANNPYKLK